MNFHLSEKDYNLNETTRVFSRLNYTGIAYNDGNEVEIRIADIIEQAGDVSTLSGELRQQCTDWPSLYHLSGTRSNILRPFEDDLCGDILEIGAGCGAITRYLGECGGNVLALEGSPRRAAIARNRTRDLANVTVLAEKFDNFTTNHKFDIITLIGVLEYANLFTTGEQPALTMLKRAKELLKPSGKLLIAIENQLGLKYFAGAPEDHIGEPMYGIEGRYRKDQPQTFGRVALSKILQEAGFSNCDFLVPFPDYKFPVSIVTESGFADKGFDAGALAWQSAHRDPQLPAILTFSPELVWQTVIQNDLALDLTNSFLVVASNSKEPNLNPSVLAWHFTTDRKKEFCKKTLFVKLSNNEIEVQCKKIVQEKTAVTTNKLLKFHPTEKDTYIYGTPLSQELIRIITRDGWQFCELHQFLKKYLNILAHIKGDHEPIPEQIHFDTVLPGTFFDYIPQNIIISTDGIAHLIDKEWELTQPLQTGYLVFRSLLYIFSSISKFGQPTDKFTKTYIDFILKAMNEIYVSPNENLIEQYVNWETTIQTEVVGRTVTAQKLMEWLNNPISIFDNFSQVVTKKDAQITNLTDELNKARVQLLVVTTSNSWRLTRPLREVRSWVTSLTQQAKRYAKGQEQERSRRIVGITRKIYLVYKNNGVNGILNKIKKSLNIKISKFYKDKKIEQISYINCFEAKSRVDKSVDVSNKDLLIYAVYSSTGRLSKLQIRTIEEYTKSGYLVALVVNTDNYGLDIYPDDNESEIQIIRENIGYDFGAWSHTLNVIGGLSYARSITFTNDSVVLKPDGGAKLKSHIEKYDADVLFATINKEVKPHGQSYFFVVTDPIRSYYFLEHIASIVAYKCKQNLIDNVEIRLLDKVVSLGLSFAELFPCKRSMTSGKNPTIYHWKELIDNGYPFLKIQLFTLGMLKTDDVDVLEILKPDLSHMLKEHVADRKIQSSRIFSLDYDQNHPPLASMDIHGLLNKHGAQQAYNPIAQWSPTLMLPLDGVNESVIEDTKILGVIHCYYTEIADDILRDISEIKIKFRLLLTTDAIEKKIIIQDLLQKYKLTGNIEVYPNRGRDVAPFLIGVKHYLKDAQYIFHLHTKKSPHDERYYDWGNYIRKNLIGSTQIVKSILKILNDSRVGLIYSDHHKKVVGLRNWGYDFEQCKDLLNRLNISLKGDYLLEFPTGTMFWMRKEVLLKLLEMDIHLSEFEEEKGQVDGTLAHAIERLLVYLTEITGYSHVKVIAEENIDKATGVVMKLGVRDIKYHLTRRVARILGNAMRRSKYYDFIQEIYPVAIGKSINARKRLTLLLPTAKPEKIYGGISSALACAKKIYDGMQNADFRIIITSDPVDRSSLKAISELLGISCTLVKSLDDVEGVSVVALAERQYEPIIIRENDQLFATAWWTADLGFRILEQQKEIFNKKAKLIYLIQDYEPGFYPWSIKYAMADATYRKYEDTIAIINSEELYEFISKRYRFFESYLIPYEINRKIEAKLTSSFKNKKIIVYGRPSVERNCFGIILEGIRLWQASAPVESCQYQIIFVGEDFDKDLIKEIDGGILMGKLSLDEYAELLNCSSIGISLMLSPHPSYPPLEMVSAGIITITNKYENKDLSLRSKNIINVNQVTPQGVAEAIEVALNKVNYSEVTKPSKLNKLKVSASELDISKLLDRVQSVSFPRQVDS